MHSLPHYVNQWNLKQLHIYLIKKIILLFENVALRYISVSRIYSDINIVGFFLSSKNPESILLPSYWPVFTTFFFFILMT